MPDHPDSKTNNPGYLKENSKPGVQIRGFNRHNKADAMIPKLAHRLIDFFKAQGPKCTPLLFNGNTMLGGFMEAGDRIGRAE